MPHPIPLQPIIRFSLWLGLVLQQPLQAQIASPSNAGGNAGNNSAGSTITPISTPTFTSTVQIPAVEGVTVTTNTGGTAVTTSPVIVTAVTTAVTTAAPSAPLLVPVVSGPSPSLPSLNNTSPVDIVLIPASGPSQQPSSVSQLVQEVGSLISQSQSLTVSSLTVANLGAITPTPDGLVIAASGQEIVLATSADTRSAVAQFAAIAIVSGLSSNTLSLGASLVNSGADPVQVARLMVGLQGLANSTELTALSTGIDAFNTLVQTANDATIQALAAQEVFLQARITLLAARTAIGN